MQVKLIQHTPDPEVTIAAAARLCYAPISAAEIVEKMSPKQVERMLRMLFASSHLSAF